MRSGIRFKLCLALLGSVGCRFYGPGVTCTGGSGVTAASLTGEELADSQLALTFDGTAGPEDGAVSEFLYGSAVLAAFFVTGQSVKDEPEVLAGIKNAGHLVGNFTYTGRDLTRATDPVSEVRLTDELLLPYVTGDMFLFRAPAGLSTKVAERLNAAGLGRYVGNIGWDIEADGDCWSKEQPAAACAQAYLDAIRAKRHGIVRLPAGRKGTADLLRLVVPKLKEEGFQFVRLDQIPSIRQALGQRGGKPDAIAGPAGCDEYHAK